ncbi:MAG TPA: LuxR C-terminal-related transcriptional regulator [Woeseiaceae bacterium]|nr:LuxR C-terminal-related transcriptional regulator [Woeseiaceae bacterium]
MSRRGIEGLSEEEWDALLGDIYDAALQPKRWSEVLQRIGRPINAHAGQLVVLTNDASAFDYNLAIGIDLDTGVPEFTELVARGLHVRVNTARRTPELTTIADYCHTSASEMKRHPFYQEHAFPLDVPYYGGTIVAKTEGAFVASVVMRSHRFGHLTNVEIAYLNRLAPHVRRSLELSFKLPQEGLIDGMISVIERISCGAVLVDRHSSIVAMNGKASSILAQSDGIKATDRLYLMDRDADSRFRNELLGALGYRRSSAASGNGYVSARRPSGRVSWTLLAIPANDRRERLIRQRFAIVLVIDPEEGVAVSPELFRETLKFTPAESGVAAMLVAGRSVNAIARARRVRHETVRSQLKSIYRKAECNNQAELVIKLLGLASIRINAGSPVAT